MGASATFSAPCAYGESPLLGECIESLLAQTVRTNILVSTSTPNDRISSAAKEYGVKLYVNEGKPGIAHDWSCAIAHCSTPLVTIAHQDDLYEPRYAETMLAHINAASSPSSSLPATTSRVPRARLQTTSS